MYKRDGGNKFYYFVMETIKVDDRTVKYGYFQEKYSDLDVLLFGDGEQGVIKDWMKEEAEKTSKEYNVKNINKAIKAEIEG